MSTCASPLPYNLIRARLHALRALAPAQLWLPLVAPASLLAGSVGPAQWQSRRGLSRHRSCQIDATRTHTATLTGWGLPLSLAPSIPAPMPARHPRRAHTSTRPRHPLSLPIFLGRSHDLTLSHALTLSRSHALTHALALTRHAPSPPSHFILFHTHARPFPALTHAGLPTPPPRPHTRGASAARTARAHGAVSCLPLSPR